MSDSEAATTTPCEPGQTPLGASALEPDDPPPVRPNDMVIGDETLTIAPSMGDAALDACISSNHEPEHIKIGALSFIRITEMLTRGSVLLYAFLTMVLTALVLFMDRSESLDSPGYHVYEPLVDFQYRSFALIGPSFLIIYLLYHISKGLGRMYSLSCAIISAVLVYFALKALTPALTQPHRALVFRLWSNGIDVPQSFKGCDARVALEQQDLFTTRIYEAQFFRREYFIRRTNGSRSEPYLYDFHPSMFEHTRQNGTLCSRGFEANADLYGLGIRSGIYLQWVSALLSKNLLSSTRQDIQKLYLAFSLAVCLATALTSFTQTCTFAIEIELLYWMYWGGYVTVFWTAPCPTLMGDRRQWAKIRWTTTVLYLTPMVMTYHAIWYAWYAYDRVFGRIPCGTYHFFVLPTLDPSQEFANLRDTLMFFATPLAMLVAIFLPAIGVSYIGALKHTVQESSVCQWFFPSHFVVGGGRSESNEHEDSISTVPAHQETQQDECRGLFHHYATFRYHFRRIYDVSFGTFSDILVPKWSGPYHGIRLITPLDVKNRRLYRITWAVLGLLSCIFSIVAIEMLLKWNMVVGIYSVTSTGQYFPLMVGIGSFISVIWSLLHQEAERRRKQRIHSNTEFGEDVELQSFSQTLSDAVSHAFSQPDAGFLSNDGAFPAGEHLEESGGGGSGYADADGEADEPYGDFVMSGALPVNNDHVV